MKRLLAVILAVLTMAALTVNVFTETAMDGDVTHITEPVEIPHEESDEPTSADTSEPVTEGPIVTDPPVTEPPVSSDTVTTDPVVTTPPTSTIPSTTEPVVTEPPVSYPPTTEPPVTTPPSTTGPSTTEPIETDPPVTTGPIDDPSIPEGAVFTINGGVLESCTGKAADVIIPDEVTRISAGAFSRMPNIKSIYIYNRDCQVDNGAFPAGLSIYALPGSPANIVANLSGCTSYSITPVSVNLTINYITESGSTIASTYIAALKTGEDFSVTSPIISGYTTDMPIVSGYAVRDDISISVRYKQSVDSGWKIVGKNIRYSENGKYLTNTTKTVDGVEYKFDGAGNVILDNEFIDIDGQTYYIVRQQYVTGYKVIGHSIYCFLDNGAMLKNTTHDGYSFDINGTIVGQDIFVDVGNSTYYLYQNALFTGFVSDNGSIYYFGEDYAMVKNQTVDSYTFDYTGKLISGLTFDQLTVLPLPNVEYNGEAHTPAVSIKFGNIFLIEGIHYTVAYSDNVEVGTATITITGIGPVYGETALNFQIKEQGAFTLTIKYQNVMGGTVAKTYEDKLLPGEEFSIESPEIEGMKADHLVIKGKMGDKDQEFKVIYSVIPSESSGESSPKPSESEKNPETDSSDKAQKFAADKEAKRKEKVIKFVIFSLVSTVITAALILAVLNWDIIKRSIKKLVEKIKNKSKARK